jgi:hypothetical protein
MITSNVSASPSLSEENRRQFTQMLPAIRRQIAIQSRLVPRSQREEFQANALGLACEMFLRLIQRDRAELATPCRWPPTPAGKPVRAVNAVPH